jgi:4-hydroxybenzoate polyprenyltransferase
MNGVVDALIFALMIVLMVAVIFSNIGFTYKIGIGALAIMVIFAATAANQALKQQQEEDKQRKPVKTHQIYALIHNLLS